MKTSDMLIWEMNEALRSAGNVPVRTVCIIHESTDPGRIAPSVMEMFADKEGVVGRLFGMSLLGKYVMAFGVGYRVSNSHFILYIRVANSGDGNTNIDMSLIEAVSKLKWYGRMES